MKHRLQVCFVVFVVYLEIVSPLVLNKNGTVRDRNGLDLNVKTRRKNDRSTSSSSGTREKGDDESNSGVSLGISLSSSSSTSDSRKKKKWRSPESSFERIGWRKWHRKCTPCPDDFGMKWRDQGIKWICGAYQHARRSFKSLCSMHLRNCQDGTMFTKIHSHRCANDTRKRDTEPTLLHGEHFFYDYKVSIEDDSSTNSKSDSSSSTEDDNESTDYLFTLEKDWRRNLNNTEKAIDGLEEVEGGKVKEEGNNDTEVKKIEIKIENKTETNLEKKTNTTEKTKATENGKKAV